MKNDDRWNSVWIAGAVSLGLIMILCMSAFNTTSILLTGDSNLGAITSRQIMFPWGYLGHFWHSPLLGYDTLRALTWSNVLNWFLPSRIYNNWIYAFNVVLASWFLIGFFKDKKISAVGMLVGVFAILFLGSNFTLLYAGHIGKFGVIMFAAAALWCIHHAVTSRRVGWAVLLGGAVGGMLLEQQDVALFFGLFVGSYAVFAWVRHHGWGVVGLIRFLVPVGVVALLIAGSSMLSVFTTNVSDAKTEESPKNPQEHWNFITQWSVPPDETIDLVAPGYTGWRSGEPEGPYWGRTGRSADWEKTGQGFMNFRLESIYIGSIPILLAMLALVIYVIPGVGTIKGGERRSRRERPTIEEDDIGLFLDRRAEVLFWGVTAVITLLLSFGKYFPLYSLFYQLPLVREIRNPNKFIQVFQLAIGILCAYGLDGLLNERLGSFRPRFQGRVKAFVFTTAGFGVLLMIYGLFLASAHGIQEKTFAAQGWGKAAPVIVSNMIQAVMIGGGLALVCAVVVWALSSPWGYERRKRQWGMAAVLVVVVALDAWALSQHYVKTIRADSITTEHAVIKFLKEKLNHGRVLLLNQSSFYNHWLSVVFPYHNIPAFNIVQMPRMPADYQQFLSVVGRNPVRPWELAAVRYALAPREVWEQVTKDPRLASSFTPVMGFDVFPQQDGVGVSPVLDLRRAGHLVLEFKGMPRFALVHDWVVTPDETVCRQLANPGFDPHRQVLVAGGSELPPPPEGVQSNLVGSVEVLELTPKQVRLKVTTDVSGVLVFSQKHAPHWQASVDGKASPVLRCNFLTLGTYVPGGQHEVVFRYAPPVTGLYVQGFGMLVVVLAGGWLVVGRSGLVRVGGRQAV